MGNKKKSRLQFKGKKSISNTLEETKSQNELQSSKMMNKVRKKQLLEANDEEDRTIKRLEKLLKLKKKKSKKKLPSCFADDGLDYLLEVIDKKDGEKILSDGSEDLENDLAAATSDTLVPEKKRKLQSKSMLNSKKQRTLTDLLKEKGEKESESEESESPSDEEMSDNDSDEVLSSNENGSNEDETLKSSDSVGTRKPKIWEDIYGRFRDESGNVIKSTSCTQNVYVPPSLRKENEKQDLTKQEELQKIKRQLKGLLNRLSESNMLPIAHQIEEMFMKYSRNDMNESLFSLMSELVLSSMLTPSRLILEQAMLISLLHANVGSEIGAYFLQHLVEKLDALFKLEPDYGDGKECNNVLIFLSHLYNFKVTHSTLIFDIFQLLIQSFRSKDIELIQLFLKNIGFVLRKDDPIKLKEIILSIQSKAGSVSKDEHNSRVSFMLDILTAIKNNNMYKIPDYDPSIIEYSKKLLKGLIRKGSSIQELAISFEDLLKAEERGRWWIVGSAWSERENPPESSTTQNKLLPKTEVSEKILEMAQKQHMNTEVRKSIFCIIMTGEDYMDVFEKLLKLNLKNQQEREIINVILHCSLNEQSFNPFYAYLAGKFCNFARKFQMALQFALWDRFKELSKLKPQQISNLARFLSHLFTSGALPLSVLKVIHFSDMDKTMVRFFRQILLGILLHDSEETCCAVFKRIAPAKNLSLLREGLRLFMHHFLLSNQSKFEPEVSEKLSDRIKLAESALNSAKHAFKL
ncbi:nucleolar MIF4G domain-containing protein 1-like isoform X2 [Uloborus diversus]|nr:nucleolar MIF4G domain-containing protein 1-like isoform X2 [Uloborus diversus]XP_054712603.1 nucleolar MIF4G domain-containing protein 1-like isoform X2 [Uloborus diversus]